MLLGFGVFRLVGGLSCIVGLGFFSVVVFCLKW